MADSDSGASPAAGSKATEAEGSLLKGENLSKFAEMVGKQVGPAAAAGVAGAGMLESNEAGAVLLTMGYVLDALTELYEKAEKLTKSNAQLIVTQWETSHATDTETAESSLQFEERLHQAEGDFDTITQDYTAQKSDADEQARQVSADTDLHEQSEIVAAKKNGADDATIEAIRARYGRQRDLERIQQDETNLMLKQSEEKDRERRLSVERSGAEGLEDELESMPPVNKTEFDKLDEERKRALAEAFSAALVSFTPEDIDRSAASPAAAVAKINASIETLRRQKAEVAQPGASGTPLLSLVGQIKTARAKLEEFTKINASFERLQSSIDADLDKKSWLKTKLSELEKHRDADIKATNDLKEVIKNAERAIAIEKAGAKRRAGEQLPEQTPSNNNASVPGKQNDSPASRTSADQPELDALRAIAAAIKQNNDEKTLLINGIMDSLKSNNKILDDENAQIAYIQRRLSILEAQSHHAANNATTDH